MEPLISVIIPSYNYEKYIRQAIGCVVAQTYKNIELVVIDDCSQDNSWRAILSVTQDETFKARFSNHIVISQNKQNMGAHATINAGITASSGQYIAILNADDLFEKNRFAVMMQAMQEKDSLWGFSKVRCIDADGQRLRSEQAAAFEKTQDKIAGKRFVALGAVAENVSISTGNLLFSRSLYEAVGGFKNYKYVHDYDFFLRACLYDEPVYTEETAYLYRLHGENSFLSLHEEGVRENRVVWLEFYREVQKGNVKNNVILENPAYVDEFYQAVCAEGEKKKTLWKLAKNPLARAGLKVFKARYHMD
ncbi:MAG: glycosyltransferase [Christensenella sp.]|uniref:glycosyltransferase family 2 protein n=1 Tax=Christensenella sp. TaxID=1935934 RepID=UPI002B21873C|nr:glycosyltransferase [Christensenella sp.]MEA5003583.1 glycosyltransferase [Christensenella sp.]